MATSLIAALPVEAQVMGSAGRLRMLSPFFGPSGIEVVRGALGSTEVATWKDERFEVLHDGLADQALAFAAYLAEGRLESPLHGHDEIVRVMAIIDEARARILSGSPG